MIFLVSVLTIFAMYLHKVRVSDVRKIQLVARSYRDALKRFSDRPDSLAIIEARKNFNDTTMTEFSMLWEIDLLSEHGKVYNTIDES